MTYHLVGLTINNKLKCIIQSWKTENINVRIDNLVCYYFCIVIYGIGRLKILGILIHFIAL